MPLAFILTVPNDQRGWDSWMYAHAQDHLEIIQAVKTQNNIALTDRQLWPVSILDKQNRERWLEWHQQAHNDFNGALNTPGQDLGDFSIQDAKKRSDWIWNNYQDHQNARQMLGI